MIFNHKTIPKGYRKVRAGEIIPRGNKFLLVSRWDGVIMERCLEIDYRQVLYGAARLIKKTNAND